MHKFENVVHKMKAILPWPQCVNAIILIMLTALSLRKIEAIIIGPNEFVHKIN